MLALNASIFLISWLSITMKFWAALSVLLICLLFISIINSDSFTQKVKAQSGDESMVVRDAVYYDTSLPLIELVKLKPHQAQTGEKIEIPIYTSPLKLEEEPMPALDKVAQRGFLGSAVLPITNWPGIDNYDNSQYLYYPPDTQGDIGPDHYVQVVNVVFAIWNREGDLLLGPANINTLWNGLTGICETENKGDPIVLYDHLADRWLLSQFAFSNGSSSGPYYQCIAISATGDPTGSWHRYEFKISDTKLNDYPKFGVWPDGYYMSVNQFEYDFGWSYAGQGVAVFERDQMLNGNSAVMIFGDMESSAPYLYGMLPSDLDGPEPPPGAPNPFMQVEENPDRLRIREFHVDWTNPENSTFNNEQTVNTAAFDSSLCTASRECIPQPSPGVKVDALSDRLMFRLQYRNFGGYQTLVSNHSVDVNGADHAGVRWYELRSSGGNWSIHQQDTFAPDSDHRWMGSAAMNRFGDIALGYSVSSETTYPSIRFTGRLKGDPLNLMTMGEGVVVNGNSVQTSSNRWGDYSMMSVDPVDDCTFWYTQEYYDTNSPSWQTRITAFRLRDCNPNKLFFPLIYH
jgi:hypothetical protein